MPLHFQNLDDATRRMMLAEFDRDEGSETPGEVYLSPRLSPVGRDAYLRMMRNAILTGTDGSLYEALAEPGMLNATESVTRKGKRVTKRVPVNAAQTMAEGEFNRYYIRGLCLRALADGFAVVEVYRARESSRARPASAALIGSEIDAQALLQDLRSHIGMAPELLPEVNSGLTVRMIG